jgi:hypothetical protein
MMFARIYRRLERLLADLRKRRRLPSRRTRPATRAYLALESLEDRLTPSHPSMVLHATVPATKVAVPHHTAAAVAAHEQLTNHNSPANEAARLALLKQMEQNAAHKAPPHPTPPAKPAPVHPAPSAPPRQNVPTPAPAPGGPPRIQPYPYPPPVMGNPPTPSPSPPIHGSPGEGSPTNPAAYIPEYCTTATFSGNIGPDGHYTSFTIVGSNPATGTRVIISYIVGTPYGVPVYHWQVTVESPSMGNWGNQCTVNQPYYMDFLPLPVSYQQPDYGTQSTVNALIADATAAL